MAEREEEAERARPGAARHEAQAGAEGDERIGPANRPQHHGQGSGRRPGLLPAERLSRHHAESGEQDDVEPAIRAQEMELGHGRDRDQLAEDDAGENRDRDRHRHPAGAIVGVGPRQCGDGDPRRSDQDRDPRQDRGHLRPGEEVIGVVAPEQLEEIRAAADHQRIGRQPHDRRQRHQDEAEPETRRPLDSPALGERRRRRHHEEEAGRHHIHVRRETGDDSGAARAPAKEKIEREEQDGEGEGGRRHPRGDHRVAAEHGGPDDGRDEKHEHREEASQPISSQAAGDGAHGEGRRGQGGEVEHEERPLEGERAANRRHGGKEDRGIAVERRDQEIVGIERGIDEPFDERDLQRLVLGPELEDVAVHDEGRHGGDQESDVHCGASAPGGPGRTPPSAPVLTPQAHEGGKRPQLLSPGRGQDELDRAPDAIGDDDLFARVRQGKLDRPQDEEARPPRTSGTGGWR